VAAHCVSEEKMKKVLVEGRRSTPHGVHVHQWFTCSCWPVWKVSHL